MKNLFEVAAEEWGDTNTIHYFVTGHTQTTKSMFSNKEELMEIFRGIADDYFSTTPQNETQEPRTADEWDEELKDNEED